jgi:hypothetical protein
MMHSDPIELRQLNVNNRHFALAYQHLSATLDGQRESDASMVWSMCTFTLSTALAVFGAWVFITPAVKAVTDSERVRYFLRNSSNQLIQALGAVAGAQSFLSNCGVNFVCINKGTQEWEETLKALQQLREEQTDSFRDWVLSHANTAFKYLWTLASVVPYYTLALDDEFVKSASNQVKHLYSLVITASLFFVQLRGVAEIQKSFFESEWFINTVYQGDTELSETKKFRRAQADYFTAELKKVETIGEELFLLVSDLIELTLCENTPALLAAWQDKLIQYPHLNHPHYQKLHNRIAHLAASNLQATQHIYQIQLYFDIMYHLEQITSDHAYLLGEMSVAEDGEPPVCPAPACSHAEQPVPQSWTQRFLHALQKLVAAVAKIAFYYYVFNYLFSVIGYGLDAGYAMADRVGREWKSLVFNTVNITSNLAFMGLCLPSMQDGWDILVKVFITMPCNVMQYILHQLAPTIFNPPVNDDNIPLEQHFNRALYLTVSIGTVLACVFSGGTNARVDEVNIPRYLKQLNFAEMPAKILDFHAWIFAWISSAVMNAWYTLQVTTAGLNTFYQNYTEHQATLVKKQNLYRLISEIGSYSLPASQALKNVIEPTYISRLQLS